MKKYYYLLLILILVSIIFCACGSSNKTANTYKAPATVALPTGGHYISYSNCDECGKRLPTDEMNYVNDCELTLCDDCCYGTGKYYQCDGCGTVLSFNNLYSVDNEDGWYCEACLEKILGIE